MFGDDVFEDSEAMDGLPEMPSFSKHNPARRPSISAESIDPTKDYKKVVHEKDQNTKDQILAAVQKNLLFQSLDKEQFDEIIDSMFEKKVKKGEVVIKQGDEGDNFYVIESGWFNVAVNGVGVVELGPGAAFGELALLYNMPRAATVTAVSDSKLWAVGRETFKSILAHQLYKKRNLYESFLKKVEILSELEQYEYWKIADALQPISFKKDDVIVKQGDEGNNFFIVIEGEAICSIEKEGEIHEMLRYGPGGYFGEIALIKDQPRAATVTAAGPVSCVTLDRNAFTRLLGPIMDILKRNIDNYKKYEEYDQ